MAQPPEVDALASRLTDIYAEVQRQIDDELERLSHNPRAFRGRARLAGLRRSIDALADHVDQQARDWIENDFPRIYVLGSGGQWTLTDVSAVTQLGQELFDDLLKASRGIRSDVRLLIRQGVREATIGAVAAGKTADQAARELARSLLARGIKAVTYRDGSQVGIKTYAEMAVRTRSAVAYNRGVLGGNRDVEFFEVSDGAGCGWSVHNDPDLAHGSIRSRDEAESFPISHPRCRRTFSPRPDLNRTAAASEGFGLVSPEQDRAQRLADRERASTQARRAARRARGTRRVS